MAKKTGNIGRILEGEQQSAVATLDRPEAGAEQSQPAPVSLPQTSKGLEIPVEKFPRLVVMHQGKRYGGFTQEEKAREYIRKMGFKGAEVKIEFVDANGYPLADPAQAAQRAKEEAAREKARQEYEAEQAKLAMEQVKESDGKTAITPRRVIQQLLDTLASMTGQAKFRFMSPTAQPMRHEMLPNVPMQQQEKITLEIIYRLDD